MGKTMGVATLLVVGVAALFGMGRSDRDRPVALCQGREVDVGGN